MMTITKEMVEAARVAFVEKCGIRIYTPDAGDLDDFELERYDFELERYDALVAALTAALSVAAKPVGEAGEMPGSNGGFTMAVFRASDVPVGTPLYAAPTPEGAAQIEERADG